MPQDQPTVSFLSVLFFFFFMFLSCRCVTINSLALPPPPPAPKQNYDTHHAVNPANPRVPVRPRRLPDRKRNSRQHTRHHDAQEIPPADLIGDKRKPPRQQRTPRKVPRREPMPVVSVRRPQGYRAAPPGAEATDAIRPGHLLSRGVRWGGGRGGGGEALVACGARQITTSR